MTAVDTHCPYCALQCATTLHPVEGPGAVAVQPRDFPTNKGGLCRKGWTAPEVLTVPDRLTKPLIRRNGELVETSWDEALDFVADRIRSLQAAYGDDSVAVFGGGGLTNEKAYALGKFARVTLRTSNVDYNGRFCMSSAAAATNRSFGIDRGLPFPLGGSRWRSSDPAGWQQHRRDDAARCRPLGKRPGGRWAPGRRPTPYCDSRARG